MMQLRNQTRRTFHVMEHGGSLRWTCTYVHQFTHHRTGKSDCKRKEQVVLVEIVNLDTPIYPSTGYS